MFPLIRSTGSKKQSKLAAHAPFSYRLTAPISIPSNNSSQDSNRSYAKRRRALLSSFGEQSPLFSKGFPKKNAKLISQTRATPNLIEKCSSRQIHRLVRSDEPGQALHHVHLDMAVHQEIAPQVIFLGALVRLAAVFEAGREQEHWRGVGFDVERLSGSDTAHVYHLVREFPALRVRMKVVPAHAEVQIEHIPADPLPGVCNDRRSVADEGASVETERGKVGAAGLDDAVLAGAVIGPNDLSANSHSHVRRVEGEVDDRDIDSARAAGLHRHGAGHHGAVDTADVIVGRSDAECWRGVWCRARIEGRALKNRRSPETAHLVKKQRHV